MSGDSSFILSFRGQRFGAFLNQVTAHYPSNLRFKKCTSPSAQDCNGVQLHVTDVWLESTQASLR
jgi:hypothetical protein